MRVPAQEIHIDDEDRLAILKEIDRLLSAGRLSSGENVERFEEEFADQVGARHGVAVASGTTALELTLQALNVRGRRVVVPGNTNFATYVAAWRCGAEVVLADVDPGTLAPRTADLDMVDDGRLATVVLVHMGGIVTPDVDRIAEWCRSRGVPLIEDAAHAHGSVRGGRHAGTFGTAGAFSFFATKVMTSGEGGMVVTGDEELATELRLLRNLGKRDAWVSTHERMGTNGRMTELAAVVGRRQLAGLTRAVAARRRVADRYRRTLGGTHLRPLDPGHPYSGYKVVAFLPDGVDRAALKARMAARGIQLAGEVYETPLHHQPALADHHDVVLPGVEESCARQICLPVYPTLDDTRLDAVTDALQEEMWSGTEGR